MRWLFSLLLVGTFLCRPAHADIITVTFSGIAGDGFIPDDAHLNPGGDSIRIKNDAFTAVFRFDTNLGTEITDPNFYELYGGNGNAPGFPHTPVSPLISATITIEDLIGATTFHFPGSLPDYGFLRVSGSLSNFTSIDARTVSFGGFTYMTFGSGPDSISENFFQPRAGGWGASLSTQSISISIDPASPVPLAVAGTGLPGILFVAGAIEWLRRRRASRQFQPKTITELCAGEAG